MCVLAPPTFHFWVRGVSTHIFQKRVFINLNLIIMNEPIYSSCPEQAAAQYDTYQHELLLMYIEQDEISIELFGCPTDVLDEIMEEDMVISAMELIKSKMKS